MHVVIWIITGLVLSALARAVSPRWQAPGLALVSGLGLVGGLAGGLFADWLARNTVPGFTAGEVGSILGASIALIAGSVLAAPHERPA